MTKKRCSSCGKLIAARAQYCIYCSAKLDDKDIPSECFDELEDSVPKIQSGNRFNLLITISSIVVIAVVFLLVLRNYDDLPLLTNEEPTTTAIVTTTTTRNAARDEWLQSFIGYWYDEHSTGKKDLKMQGGYILYISDIVLDTVTFDLLSYQGGEKGKMAFASDMKAQLVEDTLHFEFSNDGLGHSGEGFMRFVDSSVQMEVLVEGESVVAGEEHSLAVYNVFKRINQPSSTGVDILGLLTLDDVKNVAGKKTADPKTNAKGETTHTFGSLKVVVNKKKSVSRIILDYSKSKDKAVYCFECVDGTMTYDVIKTYFGEAVQDYVEQPTDIRVLLYSFNDGSSVQFTFDADDNLLVSVDYKR